MDVISRGPLRAAALVWQPKPSSFVLTVACKATFILMPGTCALASEQAELHDEDRFINDEPARSLVAAREIVPCKRHVEVVLVGSAYAPRNEPVSSLAARIAVGTWEKSIAVYGDRQMTPVGIVRDTQSFTRMPLRYERAAWSPDNPVGIRIETKNDGKSIALPNILPSNYRITSFTDKIPVAGFGPIARTWPQRMHLLAKTSPPWAPERWSTTPMPDGFDTDFFAIAPTDQRLPSIAPDELLVLDNLHAQHSRLATRLPGIVPRAIVERPGMAPAPLDLVADTLLIDSDQSQCTMIYRGYVALESSNQSGRVVIDVAQVPVRPIAASMESTSARRSLPSAPAIQTVPFQESAVELSDADVEEAESEHPARPRGKDPTNVDIHVPASAKSRGTNLPSVAMETMRLTGPVVVAPAIPFVPPVQSQPMVMAQPMAVPHPMVQQPLPNPIVPEKPLLVGVEPARIVIKAVSSSRTAEAEPPRVASSEDLEQLRKRANAAPGSAAAFSDAAADAKGPSAAVHTPMAESRPLPTAVIELLWFDPHSVAHIRNESTWKSTLEKLAKHGADRREPAPNTKSRDTQEQRDLRSLLATAPTLGMDDLRKSMTNAIDDFGGFVPPLVLLAGELVFPFDELETLKATLGTVIPFVASDKKLSETVDTISELLRTPWISGASGIADGLTMQIKTAFSEKARGLAPFYLEKHTERMLLEQKHYQKRSAFKQSCLRSLLQIPGSPEPIPTYLPTDLAMALPAFQRFRVRLIAECHAQVDQHETSSIALKALAIGRELLGFSPR